MPWGITPIHILAALGIGLIILGPRRLPGFGSRAGRGVRDLGESFAKAKDAFVAEVKPTSAEMPTVEAADAPIVDAAGRATPPG